MQLQILGGLDLTSASGEPAPDVTRQTRLMLACLALAGPKGLTRAQLCALFWPDRPSALARNSLRQALVAIKKALSGRADAMSLQSDLEVVRLSAEAGTIDVHAFRHGVQGNRDGLIVAANAYRGELLAGVEVPDDVEQFVTSHRRSLNDQAQVLAERLSKADDADDEVLELCAGAGRAAASVQPSIRGGASRADAYPPSARPDQRRASTVRAVQESLRLELRTEPDVESRRLFDTIQSSGSDEKAQPADRSVAANSAGVYPSIAIMPFDNLGDASDAYFADGVVEEITSTLSRIRDFFVIARQSTFMFKGRFVDVREVGRELGVAYVVEGTVRRGGDRLRISVQLVDAVTRAQLWSERYEGAVTEIFAFQDQIAAQVAGALKPAIRHAEIEAARRKPPTSLKAYDQVMRAFPKLWGQNASAINEAIRILRGRPSDRPAIWPRACAARVVPRAQCDLSLDR